MNPLAKYITLPIIQVKISALIGLAILLFLLMLTSISVGVFSIPISDLLTGTLTQQQEIVLYSIRLPRVLLAALVGASLAVSGAAMQGLFRNPLADPGLIGIASGAAFAVAIVIVLSGGLITGLFGLYGLSVAAFMGGLVTCLLIFRFAQLTGTFSVTYMLLAGIALNALAFAGTGFLTYMSDDQQLRTFTFWTMGSLASALWPSIMVAATIILPAAFWLSYKARELNILLLGEHEAQHLGVDSEGLKRSVIICTALCVGAAVAVSGIIGFVGLVVPHLIRLTIGPDNRLLIPASALLGAALLLVADSFARLVVSPAEMPVGILTSLIGGPFFLWLLVKQYAGRFGI